MTPTLFGNEYSCPRCEYGWTDFWTAQCDDDCPSCGARHISPSESVEAEPDHLGNTLAPNAPVSLDEDGSP